MTTHQQQEKHPASSNSAVGGRGPMLSAFLVGSVFIVGFRWFFSGPFGEVAAALMAVGAAVLAVLWLGLHYHRNLPAGQRGRGGDDLYYLGLLFTLVSLIYTLLTLFVFGSGAEAVDRPVEGLVGGFGIALISTVAGILGRILLQEELAEPGSRAGAAGQPLKAVESKILEAAGNIHRALRGQESQMNGAAHEMQQLRRHLREASDAFIHFTRVTSSHAEDVKSHAGHLLETFNQRMNAAAKQGLNVAATAWRDTAETMRKDSERLTAQTNERVAQAIERMEAASRTLEEQAATASQAVDRRLDAGAEEVAQTLRHLAEANGSLETLVQAVGRAQGHVTTLGDTASSAAVGLEAVLARELAAHKELAEGATASLARVRKAFEEMGTSMQAERGRWSEQLRGWQATLAELSAAADVQAEQGVRSAAAVQSAFDSLTASVATAQENVAALGRTTAGAATDVNAKASETMAAFAALAESARGGQQASIEAWREAAAQFADAARLATLWRDGVEDFAEAARVLRDLNADHQSTKLFRKWFEPARNRTPTNRNT